MVELKRVVVVEIREVGFLDKTVFRWRDGQLIKKTTVGEGEK